MEHELNFAFLPHPRGLTFSHKLVHRTLVLLVTQKQLVALRCGLHSIKRSFAGLSRAFNVLP